MENNLENKIPDLVKSIQYRCKTFGENKWKG